MRRRPPPARPTIAFYERLQRTTADARFAFAAAGLELATVGAFLIIAGDDSAVRPFRSTVRTLLVDDVLPYHERLTAEGAEIVPPSGCADRLQRPAPRRDGGGVRPPPPHPGRPLIA
ncbi:hypothetical protein [Nonomuraea mesophila]|uniref:hypothetical protein n=1 Tax=Nonomuraea mesophila TaxID=2530382 RepID=UPI003CCC4F53